MLRVSCAVLFISAASALAKQVTAEKEIESVVALCTAVPPAAITENEILCHSEGASSAALSCPTSPDYFPDAPSHVVAGHTPHMLDIGAIKDPAPKYARVIAPGQMGTRLDAGEEVVLGLRSTILLNSGLRAVLSAGYSHVRNGQPNYGENGSAFAQRIGAGAARSASQDIFTKSVMAPILHQDPRYYVLGPNAKILHRIVYVATRPLITRKNSGHETLNTSLLIGYAGASALSRTYYPQINRNGTDEVKAFGTSLAGAAIGFAFDEFSDQVLKAVHIRH